MEKEKVLQILGELTKNKRPMNIDSRDYGYIANENEVECFSRSSSTDENRTRIREVMYMLEEDLRNTGKDYERFIMIIEYNANELMMDEMDEFHEFYEKVIKKRKLSWGLSQHDGVERLRITLVASR